MKRVAVQSSCIKSVGYAESVLEVEFVGGDVYRYLEVPEQEHRAFLNAASKGAYLNLRVKGHFRAVRAASTP